MESKTFPKRKWLCIKWPQTIALSLSFLTDFYLVLCSQVASTAKVSKTDSMRLHEGPELAGPSPWFFTDESRFTQSTWQPWTSGDNAGNLMLIVTSSSMTGLTVGQWWPGEAHHGSSWCRTMDNAWPQLSRVCRQVLDDENIHAIDWLSLAHWAPSYGTLLIGASGAGEYHHRLSRNSLTHQEYAQIVVGSAYRHMGFIHTTESHYDCHYTIQAIVIIHCDFESSPQWVNNFGFHWPL